MHALAQLEKDGRRQLQNLHYMSVTHTEVHKRTRGDIQQNIQTHIQTDL